MDADAGSIAQPDAFPFVGIFLFKSFVEFGLDLQDESAIVDLSLREFELVKLLFDRPIQFGFHLADLLFQFNFAGPFGNEGRTDSC
jgi:hypothetical protein